jgi:diadenosine tetraphosphate (Ap4A) HIT family hydrolase
MPLCPFCPANGMVRILAENGTAYAVAALDEARNILPHRYLIIPKAHIESVLDLPDTWHARMAELICSLPEHESGLPFNISYNEGVAAGQRIKHTHAWVIFRHGEEGSHTENLGLSALLAKGSSQHQ